MEEFAKLIGILRRRWEVIIFFTLVLSLISFGISVFLPIKYSSQVTILVIQKQPNDKVDAFSAAKSAEYLGGILSKMLYTDSFIDDVKNSPNKIQWNFSSDPEKRKKEWAKEVSVKTVNNTGIVEVTVFDRSKLQAKKISEAIAWNFINNGQKYHGGGDSVEVKLIDGPIVSNSPAFPNIPLNVALAFLIGLVGSTGWFYLKDDNDKNEMERMRYGGSFDLNR